MNTSILKKNISDYIGQYITIEYTFSNQQGNLLGNSDLSGAFSFCVGNEDTIPGLECHIVGHEVGTELEFTIPMHEAYGVYSKDLINIIPRTSLPKNLQPSVGLQITINNERVMITEVSDSHITTDKNHPLAGMDLKFKAKIITISNENPTVEGCGCGNSCRCK